MKIIGDVWFKLVNKEIKTMGEKAQPVLEHTYDILIAPDKCIAHMSHREYIEQDEHGNTYSCTRTQVTPHDYNIDFFHATDSLDIDGAMLSSMVAMKAYGLIPAGISW